MDHKKTDQTFAKNRQYFKFCLYGFLKNLQFFAPFMLLIFLSKGTFLHRDWNVVCGKRNQHKHLGDSLWLTRRFHGKAHDDGVFLYLLYCSFLIFYAASSFLLLFLAMVAFAFGEAFRTGTHKAMIFEYLSVQGWNSQRTYYYGHTRAWSQWGSTVSALLAALLVFWQGSYKTVFLFYDHSICIEPYVDPFLSQISGWTASDKRGNGLRGISQGDSIIVFQS